MRRTSGWGCPAGCWTETDANGQVYCYCPDYQRSFTGLGFTRGLRRYLDRLRTSKVTTVAGIGSGLALYELEPTQRWPAPLSGFSDLSPAMKLLTFMGVAAGGLWIYSKVMRDRRLLRGASRRRRRRRGFRFQFPWQ